jgi:ubiquinone/menaquinone biosynthesis C-methylase UbiE
MTNPSDNYRILRPEEIDDVARRCANAWQAPSIPLRQYEACVRPELKAFSEGKSIAPYDALVRCVKALPPEINNPATLILDVGCSSGYYSEVLAKRGLFYTYVGCDSSEAFVEFAHNEYPHLQFHVQDITWLDYNDAQFPIVMSGGVLMHIYEYEKALSELVRVSSKYVILHRTPVAIGKATVAYEKTAYGVPVVEWMFGQKELKRLTEKYGLHPVFETSVFFDKDTNSGHYSWVFEKTEILHHPV